VSGIIGQVGPDGLKNAGNQLLVDRDKDYHERELISELTRSSALRSFNLGSIIMFFISSIFGIMFLSYLNTPQVVFYIYFIVLAIWNTIFQCLSPLTKANFLKARIFIVYLPCLILVGMQIASLVFFLRKLDEINDKVNNMYPVDEETQLNKEYFVVSNLLLFYMTPLFLAVSFVGHAVDAGRAVDAKNNQQFAAQAQVSYNQLV